MGNIETFGNFSDPIYASQRENVSKMREALLAASNTNLSSITAKSALHTITAMRIYHQIARIIRYLELMDKLEAKMYASLEATIDKLDTESMTTWTVLLKAQESLQKQMIESHKLLQPYLDLQDMNVIDLLPQESSAEDTLASMLIPQDSREKLRSAANQILMTIEESENSESKASLDNVENTEESGDPNG